MVVNSHFSQPGMVYYGNGEVEEREGELLNLSL